MTDAGRPDDTTPELDYASAAAELDAILAELEDEAVNVDLLAERVRRASELITFCRERITAAKTEVDHIVATMGETEPGSDA